MEIIKAIKSVLPNRRPIEHHEPFLGHQTPSYYLNYAVWGHDDYVEEFRNKISEITGSEQVICTNNGTSSLHTVLVSIGIKEGDRVILPSMTFVATANAVVHAGGIPYFLDGVFMEPDRLRDYILKIGGKISAVIPVHLFGHPCDIEGICKVAKEFNIKVVEDAAQALGSTVNGKHVGTFGDAGIVSFNNNKIVTTNGGGAILTNDLGVAYKAHQLATTARKVHPWLVEHDVVAWNYRMGNINAALGLSQLVEFDKILEYKRKLAFRYMVTLKDMAGLVSRANLDGYASTIGEKPNYWLNTILVDNRDEVLMALHADRIHARAAFTPLHMLPMYRKRPRSHPDMPICEDFFNRAVCLPSGSNL